MKSNNNNNNNNVSPPLKKGPISIMEKGGAEGYEKLNCNYYSNIKITKRYKAQLHLPFGGWGWLGCVVVVLKK